MPDSHEVSRRDFVRFVTTLLGTIMGAVIGIPAVAYLISPVLKKTQSSDAEIPLGSLENYPESQPTLFNFTRTKINGWEKTVNSHGVFVVRQGETVTVLSNVCTHLGCRVNWHEEQQEYYCPCHAAEFNIDGSVKSGPPPRPLDGNEKFKPTIRDGNIFITWEG